MAITTPYAVHVYQNGKHIGRLSTDGSVTNRVMYAGMFPLDVAEEIAAAINAGQDLAADASTALSAKVREFSK